LRTIGEAGHAIGGRTPRWLRRTRARSVFVLGSTTGQTPHPEREEAELAEFCWRLGACIARAGADLIVCGPFPDSADFHALVGYAGSGAGQRIHLHSPGDTAVADRADVLRAMDELVSEDLLRTWLYPRPDGRDSESVQQARLLCRLMALDHADVVVSVGGRTSTTATTLLHLAEARGKAVVPFAFLGGASRHAFGHSKWRHQPGLGFDRLRAKEAVDDAMDIADAMLTIRMRNTHGFAWPPQRIFISRARADAAYAAAASDYLARAGFDILMGEVDLGRDRMIESAIEEAVLRADLFIVLWSRSFAASRFCYDELDLALLRHHAAELQLWIINLDGSDVVPPGARAFPQVVARSPAALVELLDDLLGGARTVMSERRLA